MKRVLEYDPASGTKTWHEYDAEAGESTIITVQDVGPYLEKNRRLANDEERKKRGIKQDMWHVATIPNNVIEQWMKAGVNVFNKAQSKEVAKLLNSPEWRYLRTSTGRM